MGWTSLSRWWRRLVNLLEGCIVSRFNKDKVSKAYHYLASKDHHKKWAIPGTEKKQLAPDTIEPTSAVLSWLKSASCANPCQPSNTDSAQSSRASSSQPPCIEGSPITSGTDAHHSKTPSVDTADVDRSKMPQWDKNDKKIQSKSPTSDTAHDPKFDNVNVSSPAPDEIEAPAEVWELDTALLPQECLEISKHRSEYECSRAYNMIQNKKALDQLDLPSSVNHLFSAGWVKFIPLWSLCTNIHSLPASHQLVLLHLKPTLYTKFQPSLSIRLLHLNHLSRQHPV